MRELKPSTKRGTLLAAVIVFILLCLLATIDLLVFAPQRLAKAEQARRDAPPRVVRPSLRAAGETQERKVVAAFRIEEWRLEEPPVVAGAIWEEPADVYLNGYILVQQAEELTNAGRVQQARAKYEEAAKLFAGIRGGAPNYEPAMVEFRRRKIAEALARLKAMPEGEPEPPPQPESGAIDRPEEMLLAEGADVPDNHAVADTYLSGYLAAQKGEELLSEGEASAARAELEKAAQILDALRQQSPGFQPEVVEFRRKKIAEALAQE